MEDLIQVGLPQLVEGRIKVRHRRPVTQLDGIDSSGLMTAIAVGIDEPQDRGLLLCRRRLQMFGAPDEGPEMALPGQAAEIFLNRAVGDIVGRRSAHQVETLAPGQIHALGIGEVTFVQILNEGRIAPIKGARGAKLLDQGTHFGENS